MNINRGSKLTRRKFTASEDERLKGLVAKHGTSNWLLIETEFGDTRTARQLRERWSNFLNQSIDRHWTEEEDRVLMDLAERRVCMAHIARILGNKSSIICKNRFKVLITLRKRQLKPDYGRSEPPRMSIEASHSEATRLFDCDWLDEEFNWTDALDLTF